MLDRSKVIFLMLVFLSVIMVGCCKDIDVPQGNVNTQSTKHNSEGCVPDNDAQMIIYINDVLLPDGKVAIGSPECVSIPIIGCFEFFGANIEWNNATEASIVYNNENYTLNVSEMTFSKTDEPYGNYLYGRYGGKCVIYARDKEIFLDSHTFVVFFERFGINLDVNIDEDKCIVNINSSKIG